MNKIKIKDLKEICGDIDLIISDKDNQLDHKHLFLHLEHALTKQISYDEIVLVCETIVKIAQTKKRVLRRIEKDFWRFVNHVSTKIILMPGLDIEDDEELLPNTAYNDPGKRILSRLIGLVQEVMALKDDNSKGSGLRRASALSLLGYMIQYYHIECAKELFVNSINSKNKNEQYEALQGLEEYYEVTEDELEADLIKALNAIKNETNDRTVASTCLQIQINAGIMNELTAVFQIDDWKEEHDH